MCKSGAGWCSNTEVRLDSANRARKQKYAEGTRVVVSLNSGDLTATVLGYVFSAGEGWRYVVQVDEPRRVTIYRVQEYQLRPAPPAHN